MSAGILIVAASKADTGVVPEVDCRVFHFRSKSKHYNVDIKQYHRPLQAWLWSVYFVPVYFHDISAILLKKEKEKKKGTLPRDTILAGS